MTVELRFGRWQDVLGDVDADALICDPPYSERTHSGHDNASEASRFKGEHKRQRVDRRNGAVYSVGVSRRRSIDYEAIGSSDVDAFVASWSPRVRGWFCVLTDHVLVPDWTGALEAAGRYVFSPLACVDPGSRVRLSGDGPAQWSCWLVVARPRTREAASWGALPGAYVRRAPKERLLITGAKPIWLMHQIIADYSRPVDLVVDPCAGSGTTLVAAHRLGRRAIGAEQKEDHYELARARLERELSQVQLFDGEM